MFLRTKLGILYIGIACVCAMSGCSSKNATDTGNIRVSTGIKENIKVDTDVKVDTNTDAKKENPYSEIDKGTCIYIWEDTENKELYKSYVPLEDKIDKKDYFYKDSKVKILSTYFAYPTVSSEEFSQLAKALEKERKQQKDEFDRTTKEARELANEMVESMDDKSNIDVSPYEYEATWQPIRNDENIVTIVSDQYSYFGGAHPNSTKIVTSFNPKTGEKISIKNIAKNEKEFHKFVEKKLFQYVEQNNCKDYLFEKEFYQEAFKNWDKNWWSINGYLFVGFNTYDIAPYVAGPIVIPVDIIEAKQMLTGYGLKVFGF